MKAARTRAEPVGDGHKTGFCPADSALVDPLGLETPSPVDDTGCGYLWGSCQTDMAKEDDLEIGVSAATTARARSPG